eukprot:2998156-Amphidinium_carterae.1
MQQTADANNFSAKSKRSVHCTQSEQNGNQPLALETNQLGALDSLRLSKEVDINLQLVLHVAIFIQVGPIGPEPGLLSNTCHKL